MTFVYFYIPSVLLPLLLLLLPSFLIPSSAQRCYSYAFPDTSYAVTCIDISELKSYLHWGPVRVKNDGVYSIVYRQPGITSPQNTWISFTMGPTPNGKNGTITFGCYVDKDGYATLIDDFPRNATSTISIHNRCVFMNSEMIYYAIWQLELNFPMWEVVMKRGTLKRHNLSTRAVDKETKRTIDIFSQLELPEGTFDGEQLRKDVHIYLSIIGWGGMLPLGAMIARYLKGYGLTHSAWLHLHRTCQTMAYVIAAVGWGYGVKIGDESRGIEYYRHKNTGIAQFILATIQAFSFVVRPNEENIYMVYWDTFHHVNGYIIIFLSIFNIQQGFVILNGNDAQYIEWFRGIYISSVIMLALFEPIRRFIVLKKKKDANTDSVSAGSKPFM